MTGVGPTSSPSEGHARRRAHKAAGFALPVAALLAMSTGAVLAISDDRGAGSVSVEPSTIAAGGRIVVAGSGLGPGSDRVIVLAGGDLMVELGSIKADDAGTFQGAYSIPSHLPPGSYELRVSGAGNLSAQLAVTVGVAGAGDGGRSADPSSTAVTLIILAAAGVVFATAGVVAWRAERIDRLLQA